MLKNIKLLVIGFIVCLSSFKPGNSLNRGIINGAWQTQEGTIEQVLLLSDGYFMHTIFDQVNKEFIQSRGGTYQLSGSDLIATVEFNTVDKDQILQKINYSFMIKKDKLSSDLSGKKAIWNLLDKVQGNLSGTWRMSGRMQDGKITYSQPRARKTLKVLTGSRFQWAAINAETKEFFGTGGGSYTFEKGKYTEKIEFFSRDNSRAGASFLLMGN